jgi:endonuclease/exonuclease/phosphatase (EEP) superfamily protein YafD
VPGIRRPSGVETAAVALALLPWSWYLVRNLDARLDILALAWPVFGVAISVVCWVVAALGRRWRTIVVAASWTRCTLAVVVGPWRPLDTGSVRASGRVRIIAANLFGDHTYAPGLLPKLEDQHPDVLVLSELRPEPSAFYGGSFRYSDAEIDRDNDVGVFSRFPLRDLGLPPALQSQRGRRVRVDGPDGPFILYAMHLQKPGPSPSKVEVGFRTHKRLIDAIVRSVRAETLPVVVAGDLNLVDRSTGYRAMTNVLDDGMRAGWVGPTSRKSTTKPLLARIDHIFEPSSWCSDDAHTFTMRGSDHRGVVTTIGPCE